MCQKPTAFEMKSSDNGASRHAYEINLVTRALSDRPENKI